MWFNFHKIATTLVLVTIVTCVNAQRWERVFTVGNSIFEPTDKVFSLPTREDTLIFEPTLQGSGQVQSNSFQPKSFNQSYILQNPRSNRFSSFLGRSASILKDTFNPFVKQFYYDSGANQQTVSKDSNFVYSNSPVPNFPLYNEKSEKTRTASNEQLLQGTEAAVTTSSNDYLFGLSDVVNGILGNNTLQQLKNNSITDIFKNLPVEVTVIPERSSTTESSDIITESSSVFGELLKALKGFFSPDTTTETTSTNPNSSLTTSTSTPPSNTRATSSTTVQPTRLSATTRERTTTTAKGNTTLDKEETDKSFSIKLSWVTVIIASGIIAFCLTMGCYCQRKVRRAKTGLTNTFFYSNTNKPKSSNFGAAVALPSFTVPTDIQQPPTKLYPSLPTISPVVMVSDNALSTQAALPYPINPTAPPI